MADLDINTVIIAVAAIVVALIAASLFLTSKEAEKHESRAEKAKTTVTTPAAAPKTTTAATTTAAAPVVEKASKPKRKRNKSKAKKNSSTGAESKIPHVAGNDNESSESESEDELLVVKKLDTKVKKAAAPAPAKKSKVAFATTEPAQDDENDELPALSNEPTPVTPVITLPTTTPTNINAADFNSPVAYDGWAVVEGKNRKNKKQENVVEEEKSSPVHQVAVEQSTAAIIEAVTQEFTVDAKKLGVLIGPKGITKIGIQNITGTNINMPKAEKPTTAGAAPVTPTGPVTITVTGAALGVQKAINAMHELATKGYATLLEADDFQESYVAVHHKFLPDIIGKGGATVRTLQQHTGVKITIPSTAKAPGPDGKIPKVKIGLAGRKEKVSQARALIKDLTKFHHTAITHPGVTHVELDIPSQYFNYIIGAKGSEIKHIQNSYKVAVHIPNEDSATTNVVIVGQDAAVAKAEGHIQKIIDRVNGVGKTEEQAENVTTEQPAVEADAEVEAETATSPKAVATTTAPIVGTWATTSRLSSTATAAAAANNSTEEVDEPWMSEFAPPNSHLDLNAILPPGAKYSTTPPVNVAVSASTLVLPGPNVNVAVPEKKGAWNNLAGLNTETW